MMRIIRKIKLGKIISGTLFCVSLICLFCVHENIYMEVAWCSFWVTSLGLSGKWLSKYIDDEQV